MIKGLATTHPREPTRSRKVGQTQFSRAVDTGSGSGSSLARRFVPVRRAGYQVLCSQPRALTAPHPADLQDGRHPCQAWRGSRVCVVWHPVSLPEGHHALPRGQAWRTRPTVGRGCCPWGSAWSGCARLTGCHTTPGVQDQPLGPSLGRETSGSSEKPGEVARAFLLVSSAASPRWGRWRRVGRASWPVSRNQWLRG
jgi:hypothetical protein